MTEQTDTKKFDISRLVNDRETDFLADLFLARYGFDMSTKAYRRFKNTMIVLSHDFADTETELCEVAKLDGMTAIELRSDLENAVNSLPHPMCETFNRYYGSPISSRDTAHITMPENLSPLDSIKFLAAVFLTIITINYPLYDYIEY